MDFDILSIGTSIDVGSKISKYNKDDTDFFRLAIGVNVENDERFYIGDKYVLMHPDKYKGDRDKDRQLLEIRFFVHRLESLSPSNKKRYIKNGCGAISFNKEYSDDENFMPASINFTVYLNKEKFNALQKQINSNNPPNAIDIEIADHPKLNFMDDFSLNHKWEIDCSKHSKYPTDGLIIASVSFDISSVKPKINKPIYNEDLELEKEYQENKKKEIDFLIFNGRGFAYLVLAMLFAITLMIFF